MRNAADFNRKKLEGIRLHRHRRIASLRSAAAEKDVAKAVAGNAERQKELDATHNELIGTYLSDPRGLPFRYSSLVKEAGRLKIDVAALQKKAREAKARQKPSGKKRNRRKKKQ